VYEGACPGRFYCIGKAMQEVAFAGKDFNRAYFGRNRRNCILAGAGKLPVILA